MLPVQCSTVSVRVASPLAIRGERCRAQLGGCLLSRTLHLYDQSFDSRLPRATCPCPAAGAVLDVDYVPEVEVVGDIAQSMRLLTPLLQARLCAGLLSLAYLRTAPGGGGCSCWCASAVRSEDGPELRLAGA